MIDNTDDYHFDTAKETLDFLCSAKYFRYHPDDGLRCDRVLDEHRSLRLSVEQLNAIDPRLTVALDYYFHNKLPSAPLLRESIIRWRKNTPLIPYPAEIDVGGQGEDKYLAPPAYWNQDVEDVALRVFYNKKETKVLCIDVQVLGGVEVVTRTADRLIIRTEESLECLLPGTGARYRAALEICTALGIRIEKMKDHVFPAESVSSMSLPLLDGDELMSFTPDASQLF